MSQISSCVGARLPEAAAIPGNARLANNNAVNSGRYRGVLLL
jgi:hypothetical protein